MPWFAARALTCRYRLAESHYAGTRDRENECAHPPVNLVIYAESEFPEFTSIVTLIAQSSNKDEAQAWEIYGRWLAAALCRRSRPDRLGGRDSRRTFLAAAELNEILNPVNPAPVKLPRQMEIRQILLWVIGAVVAGGAISIGAITLLNHSTYPYEEEEQITVTEAIPATASDSTPKDTAIGPDAPFDSPVVTPETQPQPAEKSAGSTTPTATRTTTAEAAPMTASKTAPTAPSANSSVAAGQTGYYVVIGTYSTDENANKFIGQAKKTDNTLTFHKLPLGNGKIMVYTSLSASEQEANRLKRQCSASFPDAWVFKRRVR
ncbi:MAG: SPOR domain-containing protein [Alistipes indistinctus]